MPVFLNKSATYLQGLFCNSYSVTYFNYQTPLKLLLQLQAFQKQTLSVSLFQNGLPLMNSTVQSWEAVSWLGKKFSGFVECRGLLPCSRVAVLNQKTY